MDFLIWNIFRVHQLNFLYLKNQTADQKLSIVLCSKIYIIQKRNATGEFWILKYCYDKVIYIYFNLKGL